MESASFIMKISRKCCEKYLIESQQIMKFCYIISIFFSLATHARLGCQFLPVLYKITVFRDSILCL